LKNELLCQTCGRYLTIGCICPEKKELCKLCDKEFDDFDTLEKHRQSYHGHKSSSELL
jgi:hypothetical protein|tara:strand:- start:228 stop:401 length:174 start_codon:yes stop_codon:yes gene_type:complete